MKTFKWMTSILFFTVLFTQCKKDELPFIPSKGMFTVTIGNVSEEYPFFQSGTTVMPDGETDAGPALPGHSYTFSFHAGKGHKLSFFTMYGWSNDGFYAPGDEGINLYNGDDPLEGDITSQVMLWDAGTEENQTPGAGNVHDGADESENVQLMSGVGDGFDYGTVETNLKVTLEFDGTSMFTVKIENLSGSTTPISPVAWAVHTDPYLFFKEGEPDYEMGIEEIAEGGNVGPLGDYLAMNTGYVSPIGPGVWILHHKNKPLFANGKPDYGLGLENLAENGDPSILASSLMTDDETSGVYNIPIGSGSPGALFPGEEYTFSFEAKPGDYLSFASMLGQSNDLFFAPDDRGIRLFSGNVAKNGDVTAQIKLWDCGTEVNEYPGAGIHQPAQLNGGIDEGGVIREVNDEFTYPPVNQMIRVTIVKN